MDWSVLWSSQQDYRYNQSAGKTDGIKTCKT